MLLSLATFSHSTLHFPVLHFGPSNLTSLVPHFPVPHLQRPIYVPYLTLTEIYKATTKPWFSRLLRHRVVKGVGLFRGHMHMFTYLLSLTHHGILVVVNGQWSLVRGHSLKLAEKYE